MKTSTTLSDKFNFFVPAKIEKGAEKGKMKIKGVCSTIDEDSDGEFLDPDGFDFQPLITTGYFNWNHQGAKDPGAIIGRPTAARVLKDKKFFVEGFLYSGVKAARDVYDLAKTLEEEDPDRQLGFSIEGNVLQRDILNPKKVKRAVITGIAITHCAKNSNTLLSIVKGTYEIPYVQETNTSVSNIISSWSEWSNGKDINRENIITYLGDRFSDLVIDDDFISIVELELGKAMTTANIPMRESVEGDPTRGQKKLLKSNVYSQIISKFNFNIDDSNTIDRVYEFIQQTGTKIFGMTNITTDVIDKAFSLLETSMVLQKSKEEVPISSQNKEAEEEKRKTSLEAAREMARNGASDEDLSSELEKGGYSSEECEGVIKELKDTLEKGKSTEHLSVEGSLLEKPVTLTELQNVLQKSNDGMHTMLSGMVTQLSERFSAIGDLLQKSNDENSLLKSKVEELSETIEKIGSTPYPQKSVSNLRHVERFEKSQDGKTIMSLSNSDHRDIIKGHLFSEFQRNISTGNNQQAAILEKACMDIEIMKSIPTTVLPILSGLGINVTQ